MQLSSGQIHCSGQAFEILDFHDAPPCHSNGFRILGHPNCLSNSYLTEQSHLYFWDFLFRATVIFFELLPCFILIINFVSMLEVVCKHERAVRTREKQLRYNHHRVSFKAQEKSAVKIMAVVIGLFLLCYGIYIHCSFLFVFKKALCNDKEYKIPILILNFAINPIAYAFFKRDIRKEIKRRLCGTIENERNKIEPVDNGNCHPIYIS